MKKNIVALLLVALVASVSLFAVADADLKLSTTINGINYMKLTEAEFKPSTASITAYNSATANATTETVSSAADTGTIAWLSILTNKRTGFTVSLSATPLTSATTGNTYKIHYKISCDSAYVYTNGNTGVPSLKVSSITGLSAFSYAVSADLDDDQYAAALEDTYTGTVTFTYTAN
jgi:uncharacterized protein YfaP (DUF2135 family)